MNTESIKKHKDSIKGQLGLIWETQERFIGDDCNETNDININGSSLLNPTVNFVNNNHRMNNNGSGLLTLPSYNINIKNGNEMKNGHDSMNDNKANKDIAIRSLILFWNKIISTSPLGVQVWNISTDQDEDKNNNHEHKMNYHSVYHDEPIFGQHLRNNHHSHSNHHKSRTAKIKALEHNTWLCNQASFGLATQPFSHPYWLFTGHKQQIKVWSIPHYIIPSISYFVFVF